MPSCSTSSAVARKPAVSITFSTNPPMSMLRSIRSRVVPGWAVTIATSCPASALSRLDLPTLGAPTSATRRPSRSTAPRRAAHHLVDRALKAGDPLAHVPRSELFQVLLREIQRRLDQRAGLCQLLGQLRQRRRELAGQAAAGAASGRLRACVDQVGDGFRLRQVDTVVQEGAQREFARFGQSRSDSYTGQARAQLQAHGGRCARCSQARCLAVLSIGADWPNRANSRCAPS